MALTGLLVADISGRISPLTGAIRVSYSGVFSCLLGEFENSYAGLVFSSVRVALFLFASYRGTFGSSG